MVGAAVAAAQSCTARSLQQLFRFSRGRGAHPRRRIALVCPRDSSYSCGAEEWPCEMRILYTCGAAPGLRSGSGCVWGVGCWYTRVCPLRQEARF